MLTPTDEAELAETIASATGPLKIIGGGTRPVGVTEGEMLSTRAMSGITLYEPGALTLVAKAGTPVAEIEAALAGENQMLAFEPTDHRPLLGSSGEPTIGGVVAANVSGPRRVQVGACRDHLLGVRFVDGQGAVIKNGGRVMKNVTGYDLVKLMAGSRGTLGVLSEVSLKVLPKPDTAAYLTCKGLDDATAVDAMSAALGTPFEVSAAVHLSGGQTVVRIEGFADSVTYRAGKLTEALARFGRWDITTDAEDRWTWARDIGALGDGAGDIWRLSLKPSDAPGLVAKANADADAAFYDWGGARVWLRVAPGTDLRARLGPFRGNAMLIRASEADTARLGAFHPELAALAKLAAGLRAKFDPRGILNPGLMG